MVMFFVSKTNSSVCAHNAPHSTHSLHLLYAPSSVIVWSVLVEVTQICIGDFGKTDLSSFAIITSPDDIIGDRTWDTAVKSQCSTN